MIAIAKALVQRKKPGEHTWCGPLWAKRRALGAHIHDSEATTSATELHLSCHSVAFYLKIIIFFIIVYRKALSNSTATRGESPSNEIYLRAYKCKKICIMIDQKALTKKNGVIILYERIRIRCTEQALSSPTLSPFCFGGVDH